MRDLQTHSPLSRDERIPHNQLAKYTVKSEIGGFGIRTDCSTDRYTWAILIRRIRSLILIFMDYKAQS